MLFLKKKKHLNKFDQARFDLIFPFMMVPQDKALYHNWKKCNKVTAEEIKFFLTNYFSLLLTADPKYYCSMFYTRFTSHHLLL